VQTAVDEVVFALPVALFFGQASAWNVCQSR
jgi:hypothetical protein